LKSKDANMRLALTLATIVVPVKYVVITAY
jgi:hypothetical protein